MPLCVWLLHTATTIYSVPRAYLVAAVPLGQPSHVPQRRSTSQCRGLFSATSRTQLAVSKHSPTTVPRHLSSPGGSGASSPTVPTHVTQYPSHTNVRSQCSPGGSSASWPAFSHPLKCLSNVCYLLETQMTICLQGGTPQCARRDPKSATCTSVEIQDLCSPGGSSASWPAFSCPSKKEHVSMSGLFSAASRTQLAVRRRQPASTLSREPSSATHRKDICYITRDERPARMPGGSQPAAASIHTLK
jgi:hypothetical protein